MKTNIQSRTGKKLLISIEGRRSGKGVWEFVVEVYLGVDVDGNSISPYCPWTFYKKGYQLYNRSLFHH